MHFQKKSFNYFDGMWSIAIYDKKNKYCFLSRDYVGQKPLYYKSEDDYFIFSSQLKGLFQEKSENQKISQENLKNIMHYHSCLPLTLYLKIFIKCVQVK